MKTLKIVGTDLEVSRVALGCARLPEPQEAVAAVGAALDEGINLFDHADIYGRGRCEEAFSAVWREIPGLRDRIVLQSKCGIRVAGDPVPAAAERYDSSYQHIVGSVEGNLRRLKTDRLDLLLLHRPDALVEPEEVARAFDELESSGKVRYFGVSNHAGPQIDLLRKYVRQRLVVDQVELNVLHAPLVDAGVVFNQDRPAEPVRGDWTLEYCRLHDITIQTWSSLAGGAVGRAATEPAEGRAARTAELAGRLAREKGVSSEAILVAWVLRHPARLQALIGATNPDRIRAACQGDSVELTREEWYQLFVAGRGAPLP